MSRVLIVEDDPDGRGLLEHWVAADGHDIASADTGESALELVSSRTFDAALLDIALPGISGYEVARALAGSPTAVILTSVTDREDVPPDLAHAGWLSKPFTRAALREALAAAGV